MRPGDARLRCCAHLHLATTAGAHGGFGNMTVGARLPDFDLQTSGGGRVSNADLEGRRTVLYFYPKDDTPGCTLEGQEFTQLRAEFEAKGVDVFGVSPDSERSHEKFIAKCSLGVALVSDPDRVLIDSLDVWK